MSPERLLDILVAERMGFRVQEGCGELDQQTDQLMFVHGLKDFKESEACICELGLFRLLPGSDCANAWQEVPRFSCATDLSVIEECLEWLWAQPGITPRLEWYPHDKWWECHAEVAGKPSQQWPHATSVIVGQAVTAVLLQVAEFRPATLRVVEGRVRGQWHKAMFSDDETVPKTGPGTAGIGPTGPAPP